jgi:hypothetical protein
MRPPPRSFRLCELAARGDFDGLTLCLGWCGVQFSGGVCGEDGNTRPFAPDSAGMAPGGHQCGHAFSCVYRGDPNFPQHYLPLPDGSVQFATGDAAAHGSRCGSLGSSRCQGGRGPGPHVLSECGARGPYSSRSFLRTESLQPTASYLLIFPPLFSASLFNGTPVQ